MQPQRFSAIGRPPGFASSGSADGVEVRPPNDLAPGRTQTLTDLPSWHLPNMQARADALGRSLRTTERMWSVLRQR